MIEFRILLDENINPLFRRELLRREPGLSVWRINDPGAPPESTLDPEILLWCEQNNFVLVTNNRKSMPLHLQSHLENGRHIPGIVAISDKIPIRVIIEDLALIAAIVSAEEIRDKIVYLPFR